MIRNRFDNLYAIGEKAAKLSETDASRQIAENKLYLNIDAL